MTALIRAHVPTAPMVLNWGRPVARCPMCPGGVLADGRTFHECWSCGQPFEIVYPPRATLTAVARILMLRPDPTTRNWEGETIHDLLLENAAHGLLEHLPSGPVLGWNDRDGLVLDALPARPQLAQVGA